MEIKSKRRFKIIIFFVAVLFSVIILRVINLMFFKKDTIFPPIGTPTYSERGFIVDRNGEKLALSLETYSVYARPNEVEQKKDTAQQLANLLVGKGLLAYRTQLLDLDAAFLQHRTGAFAARSPHALVEQIDLGHAVLLVFGSSTPSAKTRSHCNRERRQRLT